MPINKTHSIRTGDSNVPKRIHCRDPRRFRNQSRSDKRIFGLGVNNIGLKSMCHTSEKRSESDMEKRILEKPLTVYTLPRLQVKWKRHCIRAYLRRNLRFWAM